MLAPLTIDQFHRRFLQEGAPYWWAHDAHRKSEVVAKFRDDEPDLNDEDKLEYSWLQLEELFQTHPYGHLKVVAKTSPTSNKGNSPTLYVKWGDGQPASYGSGRNQPQIGYQNTGQGMGGWQMFQFMLQQQQQFYQQLLKNQDENARLNFENQRLAEAIEGAEEPSMQETLLKEGIGLLKTFVAQPTIQPQQQAALGTMGQKPKEIAEDKQPTGGQRLVSLDAIMADINLIRNSLPDYHINDIIRALALFSSQNKEQAAMLLGPMISQLKQNG